MTTGRTYRQHGWRHRGVAREHARPYEAGDGSDRRVTRAEVAGARPETECAPEGPRRQRVLREGVEAFAEMDLDPLDDTAIRTELEVVQQAIRQLTAFRARAAGELERRALRTAGPGRERQALGASRRRLAEDLRLTPSEAKRDGETGRRIADLPAAQGAMRAGDLPPDHARVLAETLQPLHPRERPRAEEELLEAAKHEDARTFGRTCRRLLARVDAEAAQEAQDRRNARRGLRLAETPDGMTALHGQGSGADAEFVHTAIHAFSRPDARGQHRTPEQRNWDALVTICRVALDAGEAPRHHGVRPHFLVTVSEATVRTDEGAAEAAWTGPLPWVEVRRLLADSGVSRVITDAAGLPVEASVGVRNVPAGLRKLLHVRDATCAGDGCDVPAAWCQIMHLDVPFRLQGRLTPETAAPGCNFHHRMLDRNGWMVTWVDGHPVVHHPDRPPRPPRGARTSRTPATTTAAPTSTRSRDSSDPPRGGTTRRSEKSATEQASPTSRPQPGSGDPPGSGDRPPSGSDPEQLSLPSGAEPTTPPAEPGPSG